MPKFLERFQLKRFGAHLRVALLVVVLGWAIYKFGSVVHAHYPIHKWLFWLYAKYWVLTLWWTAGCLAAGHALLKRLLGGVLPVREHAVMSFGVGLYAFFLLVFLGGLPKLFGTAFFLAVPTAMLAFGALPAWRYVRRLARHVRAARRRTHFVQPWWSWPVVAFGVISLVAIYLTVILPENVGYDARWYHLPIAEHYSAAGGVVRFAEGWFPGTNPHMASIIYTWAFQIPLSGVFDRVQLSAHLEFAIFLWTLASVPALVRRMVPRTRAGWSWVVVFLFPGIFLYDGALNVNADHIAAFWAIPIFLALLRAWETLSPRRCVLLAIPLSAAMLCKLTAMSLATFPILAVAGRAVFLAGRSLIKQRRLDTGWLLGSAAALGAGALFTAPYWLKNWVWYGAPFYPVWVKHFHPRPWVDASARLLECCPISDWQPTRDWAGLWESLKVLYTFSFVPNDWDAFHGTVPVFGSLFTFTVLCLPLLRNTRRLWGLFLAGHVGLFVWYWIHHQDRYLQALLPWMAAATASVLVLAWRSHLLVRIPLVLLVGAQLVWGADVYFIPTHTMIYTSPIKHAADFLAKGYKKDYDSRLKPYSGWHEIGRTLKRHEHVLLVHDDMQMLGLRVRTVTDDPHFQAGIDYGSMRSWAEVYDLLNGMGVTHLMWMSSRNRASLASDLVFFTFAAHYGQRQKVIGGSKLAELPFERPSDAPFGDTVALFACDHRYKPGLYQLRQLTIDAFDSAPCNGFPAPVEAGGSGDKLREQVLRADFIIWDTNCRGALPAGVDGQFDGVGNYQNRHYWARKRR